MTSFSYPKSRHTRQEKPPAYESYGSYRPYLQREFGRKCVYCRFPDTLSLPGSFGVDHYKPAHHFPALKKSYGNLYYCCNPCNSRKRDYWPESATAATQFIPNPCDHVMWAHLRYAGEKVMPRSDAGRFTEDRLDLNAPDIVGHRALILDSIANFKAEARSNDQLIVLVRTKLKQGKVPATKAASDIAKIEKRLLVIYQHLEKLSGNTPI